MYVLSRWNYWAYLCQISKDVGTDLDTIINCASLFEDDSAKNITVENFSKHMDINLLAPILLSKHLCKIHQKDRDNNIINIIDQRVMRLNPSYFSYSVSKFGLWGGTQMMAQEYSPTIRVNAIAPGPFPTEGAWARLSPKGQLDDNNPMGSIPMGRTGEMANSIIIW